MAEADKASKGALTSDGPKVGGGGDKGCAEGVRRGDGDEVVEVRAAVDYYGCRGASDKAAIYPLAGRADQQRTRRISNPPQLAVHLTLALRESPVPRINARWAGMRTPLLLRRCCARMRALECSTSGLVGPAEPPALPAQSSERARERRQAHSREGEAFCSLLAQSWLRQLNAGCT